MLLTLLSSCFIFRYSLLFRISLEYAMNVRGETFNRMYRAKSPNVVYSERTLTIHIFAQMI